jgi:hypothetical protein
MALSDTNKLRLYKAIENRTLTNNMVDRLFASDEDNPILTLVDDDVLLGPACGYETIARATKVFTGGIYYYGCNEKEIDIADQQETGTRPGRVYAMDPDKCTSAALEEMFTTFGDPGQVAVSQGEIITFCKRTPEKLRQGVHGTFFLFEVEKDGESNHFVAGVNVDSGGLWVGVHRFGYDDRWDAEIRHHLVVPQL